MVNSASIIEKSILDSSQIILKSGDGRYNNQPIVLVVIVTLDKDNKYNLADYYIHLSNVSNNYFDSNEDKVIVV